MPTIQRALARVRRAAQATRRVLGLGAVMVFGRWRWQSPGWLGWLGRHAARSWRYLIAKPIRAASFVVVLAAAGGALAWYLTRPTPEYVDYTVVPPGLTEYTKTAAGVRLLSDEASFITLDMLRHNPRPGADPAIPVRTQWPVAWKTGTSWGFRDAWSAGVAGPYVLVVWIGNFGGQGNPAFVGVDAAAPLFFRIVDALSLARPSEGAPLHTPPGVRKVAVCAGSGDLPNADCPYTVDTWYIPGKSPIRVSQLHRRVALDAQMERAVCPPYPPGTRFEIFEFWSSDMLKLFREAGMPRHTPPALPACAVDDPSETPTISSPLRNVSYTLRRSRAETIALDASVAADVRRLFWFDGGALVASRSVADGALAWEPSGAGLHVIRVVDDRGRSAVRDVEVQFAR